MEDNLLVFNKICIQVNVVILYCDFRKYEFIVTCKKRMNYIYVGRCCEIRENVDPQYLINPQNCTL